MASNTSSRSGYGSRVLSWKSLPKWMSTQCSWKLSRGSASTTGMNRSPRTLSMISAIEPRLVHLIALSEEVTTLWVHRRDTSIFNIACMADIKNKMDTLSRLQKAAIDYAELYNNVCTMVHITMLKYAALDENATCIMINDLVPTGLDKAISDRDDVRVTTYPESPKADSKIHIYSASSSIFIYKSLRRGNSGELIHTIVSLRW